MNKTKVLLTSVYSHSLCILAPFLRLLFYLLIMNRGIKTVATTAFCCLVALTGCNKQQQAMDTGSYKTMTVKTDSIVLQSLYSARIEGRQDVEIYPQVSGTLQRLCVQEGDRVKKGQTLFIIDQVPYQAALNTAEANLKAAEAAEEVKDAAVKEVEPKAEKAVEADIKEVAAAAKETVKDTGAKVVDKAKEVTKKVEKTVKEKVAEVKAAAADPEVYVQYQGNESNLAVITERIKKQYVEEGHKESDIKSLKIYLKPEDASAYYVINDNNSGKVFLF